MRFLENIEIDQVVTHFDVVQELCLESSTQIEPDAFLYKFRDKIGSKYGLICRDYIQDDASIETRVLLQEQALIVLNWVKPIDCENDYRVFMENFDSFTYMFALFKYEEKPQQALEHIYRRQNKLPRCKHPNATRAFVSCYIGARYLSRPRYARYDFV